MIVQPSQKHNHGKYDNNGKGGYFRFDDDNKMNMNMNIFFQSPKLELASLTHATLYMQKGNRNN